MVAVAALAAVEVWGNAIIYYSMADVYDMQYGFGRMAVSPEIEAGVRSSNQCFSFSSDPIKMTEKTLHSHNSQRIINHDDKRNLYVLYIRIFCCFSFSLFFVLIFLVHSRHTHSVPVLTLSAAFVL